MEVEETGSPVFLLSPLKLKILMPAWEAFPKSTYCVVVDLTDFGLTLADYCLSLSL